MLNHNTLILYDICERYACKPKGIPQEDRCLRKLKRTNGAWWKPFYIHSNTQQCHVRLTQFDHCKIVTRCLQIPDDNILWVCQLFQTVFQATIKCKLPNLTNQLISHFDRFFLHNYRIFYFRSMVTGSIHASQPTKLHKCYWQLCSLP